MISSKRRLLSYVLFLVGIMLLTGSVLYYFHTQGPRSEISVGSVPEMLADLRLVQIITGREAIDSIHQLHGNEFPLDSGAVAVYGNQNVTLWVSDAGSVSSAMSLIGLMNDRIAEGNSPFIVLGDLDLGGYTVYALEGMGQAHYYWQAGQLVLWLVADISVAQQAILEGVEFYR